MVIRPTVTLCAYWYCSEVRQNSVRALLALEGAPPLSPPLSLSLSLSVSASASASVSASVFTCLCLCLSVSLCLCLCRFCLCMGTVPVLLLHCIIRKRTKKQQKENSTTSVQYPVLVRVLLSNVVYCIPYRTDEHSLGTRIRTVTRASEITRVPIYGPIRVA